MYRGWKKIERLGNKKSFSANDISSITKYLVSSYMLKALGLSSIKQFSNCEGLEFDEIVFDNFMLMYKREKRAQEAKNGGNKFSQSKWTKLRYKALKLYNNYCACCGAKPSEEISLHVDHIKPKSIYPELMYEISNLQILCEDCNLAKSFTDETDWK